MAVIASLEALPGGAMDGVATLLTDARDAYARRDWPRARDGFRQARALGSLPADDVYALADAAWWLGLIDEALAAYEEAYHCFVTGGASPSGRRHGPVDRLYPRPAGRRRGRVRMDEPRRSDAPR